MSRPSSQISPDRTLVASFHDVAPHTRADCDRFLQIAACCRVPRVSLLVMPRWRDSKPISQDAGFVKWLHARTDEGHEVVLHGLRHVADHVGPSPLEQLVGRIYTAGEGEFLDLGKDEAAERLAEGLAILEQCGLPVSGFTAPAWLAGQGTREALLESGLRYHTTLRTIHRLSDGGEVRAPVLVPTSRSAARRVASQATLPVLRALWSRRPVLRLAAHPADMRHDAIEALLASLFMAERPLRTPLTYGELVASRCEPLVALSPLQATTENPRPPAR
jgi:predicted deacetylase